MATAVNRILGRIEAQLRQRDLESSRRRLIPRTAGRELCDLSNNDYLRLSRHPQVIAAAREALEKWGASSSASPLISGYTDAHASLEAKLCAWSGFAHGLIWNTGHSANQAILSGLPQAGDLVFADRFIHQSMISGLLRSGARLQRYRHRDLDHLASLLRQADCGRSVFVVTESVFSVDGDAPDLRAMAALKERHGFFWIVDEAHAIGWYGDRGSGLVEAAGVADQVDVLVGTLGKGLGSMGAFTLFQSEALREFCVNHSSEFIYSTYLAPACAVAAAAAVDIVASRSDRPHWQARSRALRGRLPGAPAGDSPIIPVRAGENEAVLRAASRLRAHGFVVGAVRPPTVPQGEARLRISLHTELSSGDEDRLVAAVEEALR